MMASVISYWLVVCCALELAKPPEEHGPVTVLGMVDEQLLVLRLGFWPNGRIGPRNFGKIRPGMTEGDIAKVLGDPHTTKDVSKFNVTKMVPVAGGARGFRLKKTNTWVGMHKVIVIDFGEQGTVEWQQLRSLENWASQDCGFDTRDSFTKLRDSVERSLRGK
jgi:hypothetical protein